MDSTVGTGVAGGSITNAPVVAEKELIDQIRLLRVGMSRIIKFMNGMDAKTRYKSMAFTSLECSRMWLGKVLGKLKTEYPYPESTDPNSKVIAPAADTAEDDLVLPEEFRGDKVAELKCLRSMVSDYVKEIEKIYKQMVYSDIYPEIVFTYQRICETNMWLGMALGELRGE